MSFDRRAAGPDRVHHPISTDARPVPGKRTLTGEGPAAIPATSRTPTGAAGNPSTGALPPILSPAPAGADAPLHASTGPTPAGGEPSRERLTLWDVFGRSSVRRPESDPQSAPVNAQVQAAAARGTATPATTLPFAEQIQRAFGRHDISGIRAHTGRDAAASARDMGARAYATGDHVVLGAVVDLRTVAHEAAHVVQQREGVQLEDGIGAEGDTYEQHADEVATRVVQGESAEVLLDSCAGAASSTRASGCDVQRFIEYDIGTGHWIENGRQPIGARQLCDERGLYFAMQGGALTSSDGILWVDSSGGQWHHDGSRLKPAGQLGQAGPSYEPEAWNSRMIDGEEHNPLSEMACYTYATNFQSANREEIFLPGDHAAAASGLLDGDDIPDREKIPAAIDSVSAAAEADGLEYIGKRPPEQDKQGYYLVCLLQCAKDYRKPWHGRDYHWRRRDADGQWSEKLGQLDPQRVTDPSAPTTIRDERGKEVNYDIFVGYFWCPESFDKKARNDLLNDLSDDSSDLSDSSDSDRGDTRDSSNDSEDENVE